MTTTTSLLFLPEQSIYRMGPTVFPKPTHLYNNGDDENDVIPLVRPLLGRHRPDVNAVFAYAEGYVVGHYVLFLQTLRNTGYDGDVVLAIADEPQDDVVEYLQGQSNVVVYGASLFCYASDRITPSKRTIKNKSHDIFQMCQLQNVYGKKRKKLVTDDDASDSRNDSTDDAKNTVEYEEKYEYVSDVRAGRVVATLRYEWYWIWSLQYNPDRWILLLDARDSIFQVNPFANLPTIANDDNEKDEADGGGGTLYFFGENANATRLGKSTKNVNWLRNAYGSAVLNSLRDKPTLCSGSTMGTQRAVETYLRAMVNEWDETDISMTGADQGFHNYLYYSGKLQNARGISRIVVWEQGKGIVNNLGALRTKPLSEWGIYNNKTHEVFNCDGSRSPVAHQWDRDQHLFRYTNNQRMRHMVREWKTNQQQQGRL